jgi:Bifunctional DNA primase/polymerase, N-terminal/Family of unknown function (DUF5906)/Primase C terminal 2 (PriCT-2)
MPINKTDLKQALQPYLDAGYSLIPLHKWDAKKTVRNKRTGKTKVVHAGKQPRDYAWPTAVYDSIKIAKAGVDAGFNVGVRLTAEQLVADIDLRAKGDRSWAQFQWDHNLNDEAFPRVQTGSGGSHFYLQLPPGVKICETLEDYPGIEFKSTGRQVVAAGSRHPNGEFYVWDATRTPLDAAPMVPAAMLKAIERPPLPHGADGANGGEATPEQIAKILAALDPTKYAADDLWFPLMCECHHASGGDARDQFIEWSLQDPDYADDERIIGRRWDSLHRERNGVRTYKSLNNRLRKAGKPGLQIRTSAAEDFADAPEIEADAAGADDGIPKLSQVTADTIGKTFSLVNMGGKIRIVYWGKSDLDPIVRVPEFWAEPDFHRALVNKKVTTERTIKNKDGEEETKKSSQPLSHWWLTKKDRYTFDGLIFDSKRKGGDEINLWRGFGVEGKPGTWNLMEDHIREVIASGDAESFEYIIKWIAWGFQNPTTQAEVAIALSSEGHGTGKGILGRTLGRIYGAHAVHISKRELLVGRFNAHFMMASFLFCDEALWPGRKEDEGPLKTVISEPTFPIERKGIDPIMMPNALKVFLASNNSWLVPAATDERRFAAFEVSEKHKQNFDYFRTLQKQMDDGGCEAMLYDLSRRDLDGWHPRNDIPQTEALTAQKILSMKPELQWLAGLLEDGVLPCQKTRYPNRVDPSPFYEQARRSVPALRWWSDVAFVNFLDNWGVTLKRSNGNWREFPPLSEMRRKFVEQLPFYTFRSKLQEWGEDSDFSDPVEYNDADFG